MIRLTKFSTVLALVATMFGGDASAAPRVPQGDALVSSDDLSVRMLEGLHRHADRQIEAASAKRGRLWRRDVSSRAAYERSVEPHRQRFRKIIGVVDPRLPPRMERFGDDMQPALVARTAAYTIWQVRWPVLDGVTGEGLLLEPSRAPAGQVVVLPDADETPEQIAGLAPGVTPAAQFARRLAHSGYQVVVPMLLSRRTDQSGNPQIAMTNETHREWIYRQAYHMGRHVIGYEVQKVLAAVDWFKAQGTRQVKVGVAGLGEGGLIAMYAAAVDTRIDAALVSGYFEDRHRIWNEPLYRQVWGLLSEFGDAEIASLVAPRALVIENAEIPRVDGPPPAADKQRAVAAPGVLATPAPVSVASEWRKLEHLVPAGFQPRAMSPGPGIPAVPPGTSEALDRVARLLGRPLGTTEGAAAIDLRKRFDPAVREARQVKELERHVQALVQSSPQKRRSFFLNTTSVSRPAKDGDRYVTQAPEVFAREAAPFRRILEEEILGKVDDAPLPLHARVRTVYDQPAWTGYEITLDVFPDVFAWGVLLVPKNIADGERRPVVVCQHGLEGLPKSTIEGNNGYHGFAARLAERGFVTFAPHNPYRGNDVFRVLDRKAQAVKASLFAYIVAQHRQILRWLGTLPFVDASRIALYGLSYGGKTAMRVPEVIPEYALSIASGDFNDWTRKVTSVDYRNSYMFTHEWEIPTFDMGNTFGYAEAAYLMVPRPFMVERGHHDGVGYDDWVAAEYAKVRWLYAQLGLPERTAIEFYNGGHEINGKGTFEFLHRHLSWPAPRSK